MSHGGARVALTIHLDKVCSNNTSYVCHHRKVLANNHDDSCFLKFPLRNDGTNSLIGLLPCTTPPISSHHTSFLFSYSIHLFIYYLPSPPLFFLSVYRVFVLEEDSDSVSRGAFFPCCTCLSFFSCMFSMLEKAPLPACSRERVLSGAVP